MAVKNLGRVQGYSAYEIWLQAGNVGTEQEFLDSLKGRMGKDGVGVKTITGNPDGSWIITYTDGSSETISNEAYNNLVKSFNDLSGKVDGFNDRIENNLSSINNIKTEQTTQNKNIKKNTDDISGIKTEQTTQNNAIEKNKTDIANTNTEINKAKHTTMIVTAMQEGSPENIRSDYNSTQIKRHADDGGIVILRFNAPDGTGEQSYQYETYKDGYAIFRRAVVYGEEKKVARIIIKIDNNYRVTKEEEMLSTEDSVLITYIGTPYTDDTDAEIIKKLDSCFFAEDMLMTKPAYLFCKNDIGARILLVSTEYDGKNAYFSAVSDNGKEVNNYYFKINRDNSTVTKTYTKTNFYTKEEIDNQQNAQDTKISDLTKDMGVAKEDISKIKGEQTAQNKEIASNTKRIKTLETNIFDSGVASGENINIKDSALAEFQEIKSSIIKAQETTEGYNLLNINKIDWHSGKANIIDDVVNIDFTLPSDATYLPISSPVDNTFLKPNTKYYLSLTNSFDFNFMLQLIYINGDYVPYEISAGHNKLEFTTRNEDISKLYFFVSAFRPGVKIKGNTKLQISEIDKPYEIFTGGPTPRPDYPQEIATIKENWETVSCGKNLFDINNFEYAANAEYNKPRIPKLEGNKVSFGGVYGNYGGCSIIIPIQNNKSYSLRAIATSDDRKPQADIALIEDVKDLVFTKSKRVPASIVNSKLEVSFTNDKNYKYISLFITSSIPYGAYAENIQLEVGTEPTPYEPYQGISTPNDLKGNEFLPGDNIIKKFNVEDGKYWVYLEKNMGKIVLNGNEDWSNDGKSKEDAQYFYIFNEELVNSVNNETLKSNYFSKCFIFNRGSVGYDATSVFILKLKLSTFNSNINDDINTRTTKFKQWLSVTKPKFIYELTNKKEIPLGSLDQMNMTYNPETNLFSSIGNLYLEAKYYRDFKNTIWNMQNSIETLENKMKEIESHDYLVTK